MVESSAPIPSSVNLHNLNKVILSTKYWSLLWVELCAHKRNIEELACPPIPVEVKSGLYSLIKLRSGQDKVIRVGTKSI